MNYKIEHIGKNKKPSIAIVGCVHGDEVIGQKIIRELKKIKIEKGNIALLIANEQAFKKRKRYIKEDLNRVFPGIKGGGAEKGLAYKIKEELKKYDLVIDIHATSSNFDRLAVVTRLDKKMKQLLRIVPIKKVALVRSKVFGGKELISHVNLGISLEYGFGKDGKNYKKCLRDIRVILKNLNMISGKKQEFHQKELYTVSGVYPVVKKFKQDKNLVDFKKIKKDQIIGSVNSKQIKSKKNFYPIFLGKGKYKKTLSLITDKKIIKI